MLVPQRDRILLIEDDDALRGLIEDELRARDYDVVAVASAEAALGPVTDPTLSVVLTDMNMAGMSGIAFCERVLATREDLPVVVMTAYGTMETAIAAIAPIAAKFAKWLEAVEPMALPSEPLNAAVGYYRWHWDALMRFIKDPQVPIDNSPTERGFQDFAKLRLNMVFAGSTESAHRACVLLGVVATCRAAGVPAQAYLARALERLGTHREHFGLALEDMTSAAFKAAVPAREIRRPTGRRSRHPGLADRSLRRRGPVAVRVRGRRHDHVREPKPRPRGSTSRER